MSDLIDHDENIKRLDKAIANLKCSQSNRLKEWNRQGVEAQDHCRFDQRD